MSDMSGHYTGEPVGSLHPVDAEHLARVLHAHPRCLFCGSDDVRPQNRDIYRRRRVKFGATWLIATVCTGGLALPVYLIWPRRRERIAVDRWLECRTCGQTYRTI